MRILVTGGAGYIGSHTCQALAARGHVPVTIDNLSRGFKEAVQWGPFYQVDILETEKLTEIIKSERIEAVLHFAAFAYVGESVSDPVKYYQNNVLGSLSLLTAMKKADVKKIIFSSTCATYGIPQNIPIDEDNEQKPINPYGKSKLMVEDILREFVKAHEFSVVSLRYFNASGADTQGLIGERHEPETHLIPLTIRASVDPDFTLHIFGDDYSTVDGTCIRDYIHVMDLADAHILSLQKLSLPGFHFFNLGTGQGVSVKEIVAGVEKIIGKPVKVKISPRREGDPAVLIANGSKARKSLGWKPRFSDVNTIIKTAHQWYIKNA